MPEKKNQAKRQGLENLREPLFNLVILLNIVAVFTGLWYYWDQMAATPLSLLIFVPDCPLYVLLSIPILLKWVKNDAYSFLVSVGMAKYGLWTVFVLFFNWELYFLPDFLLITAIFIIGHLGMALEGAVLLPKKRINALALAIILAWFLLNDYADYFHGTRPLIPENGISLVRDFTIAASFLLTLGAYFFRGRVRRLTPVDFGRWLIRN